MLLMEVLSNPSSTDPMDGRYIIYKSVNEYAEYTYLCNMRIYILLSLDGTERSLRLNDSHKRYVQPTPMFFFLTSVVYCFVQRILEWRIKIHPVVSIYLSSINEITREESYIFKEILRIFS